MFRGRRRREVGRAMVNETRERRERWNIFPPSAAVKNVFFLFLLPSFSLSECSLSLSLTLLLSDTHLREPERVQLAARRESNRLTLALPAPQKKERRNSNGRSNSKGRQRRSSRCRRGQAFDFLFLFVLFLGRPPAPGPRPCRTQGLGALEDALRARRAVHADQGGSDRRENRKGMKKPRRRRMVAVDCLSSSPSSHLFPCSLLFLSSLQLSGHRQGRVRGRRLGERRGLGRARGGEKGKGRRSTGSFVSLLCSPALGAPRLPSSSRLTTLPTAPSSPRPPLDRRRLRQPHRRQARPPRDRAPQGPGPARQRRRRQRRALAARGRRLAAAGAGGRRPAPLPRRRPRPDPPPRAPPPALRRCLRPVRAHGHRPAPDHPLEAAADGRARAVLRLPAPARAASSCTRAACCTVT